MWLSYIKIYKLNIPSFKPHLQSKLIHGLATFVICIEYNVSGNINTMIRNGIKGWVIVCRVALSSKRQGTYGVLESSTGSVRSSLIHQFTKDDLVHYSYSDDNILFEKHTSLNQ